MSMKTKLTLSALALLAAIGLLFLLRWNNPLVSKPRVNAPPAPAAVTTSTDTPITAQTWKDDITAPAVASSFYETAPEAASIHTADTRFETANRLLFPELLAELERMPESPVKDDMLRETLTKWAALEGAAAAMWAKLCGNSRRFLPEILQAWAGTGADSAVSAWAFAKAEFSADRDEAAWLAPGFVTSAFRAMSANPGEEVWNELAGLSGTKASAAMMGMADFASNRQVNTDFTSAMERRVLDYDSPPLAAAFYASAGHIERAKNDLALVTDSAQWHAIAREVARQQAEFEPAKAIEWLQSQFTRPEDAIADLVAGVGMMHELNAKDVLNWLRELPSSDPVNAGIATIEAKFPMLRVGVGVDIITLEPDP